MMQKVKSKFLRFIKSKRINVFLLFLVLSFMFLLLTKLTQDYTKTISFNIEPINERENYVVLKDSSHVFDITLSTYGFNLLKYYLTNTKLTVDLSELDSYEGQYIWTKSRGIAHLSSQFTENVKILAVNPDSIYFKFDINAIKLVPVKLRSKITYLPGYDISGIYKLEPDSIKVIGPKILLDSINQVETEQLLLDGVNYNLDQPLNVILPDSSESLVYSHKKIYVKAIVEKFTEGSIEVPVDVINVPDSVSINYFPKTIDVLYYTSLNNFKNISKSDFIVECDFLELSSENLYLEPRLKKSPESIKSAKLSNNRIEFLITK